MFLLWIILLVLHSRNICLVQGHKNLLGFLLDLHIQDYEKCYKVQAIDQINLIDPEPLVENIIHSPLNYTYILPKISRLVFVYFCTVCPVPLISSSVLMLIPHFLDDYNFIIKLEEKQQTFSNFVFFVKVILASLGPFQSLMKFRTFLSISTKKSAF